MYKRQEARPSVGEEAVDELAPPSNDIWHDFVRENSDSGTMPRWASADAACGPDFMCFCGLSDESAPIQYPFVVAVLLYVILLVLLGKTIRYLFSNS